eukprot:1816298-Pyramimonas_sp.AAC.1
MGPRTLGEGCSDMGGKGAWKMCHWSLRWSSLWDHESCDGCAVMAGTHVSCAIGAFGGAPYGATKH